MINEQALMDDFEEVTTYNNLFPMAYRSTQIRYLPEGTLYNVYDIVKFKQDNGSWLTKVFYSSGMKRYCRSIPQLDKFGLVVEEDKPSSISPDKDSYLSRAVAKLATIGKGVTVKDPSIKGKENISMDSISSLALKGRVCKVVQELLFGEEVKATSTLDTLSLDSLDKIKVVMAIEEEFDLEIDDYTCEKWKAIQDIVDYVSATIKKEDK